MIRRLDQQYRGFYELFALILNLLRSPPTSISFSNHSSVMLSPSRRPTHTVAPQITPPRFASLLLGISLAMMLCGSVTFFIRFMLMPWVLELMSSHQLCNCGWVYVVGRAIDIIEVREFDEGVRDTLVSRVMKNVGLVFFGISVRFFYPIKSAGLMTKYFF